MTNSETGEREENIRVTVTPSSLIVRSVTQCSSAVSLCSPSRAAVRHVQPGLGGVYPGRYGRCTYPGGIPLLHTRVVYTPPCYIPGWYTLLHTHHGRLHTLYIPTMGGYTPCIYTPERHNLVYIHPRGITWYIPTLGATPWYIPIMGGYTLVYTPPLGPERLLYTTVGS